ETGVKAPFYPMVRGRLIAVNGVPLDTRQYTEHRARRLAEREFNLSWTSDLPKSNRIIEGKWWDGVQGPDAGMSMENGIATALRLKMGDALTFDIAGTPLTTKIASLRKVEWD